MAEKLAIDALNIAYRILKASTLFNEVGGKFFKGKKTDDFKGECVVFTVLPMREGQLQECRVNVNIYVPNLKNKINGKDDYSQANYSRLEVLSAVARSEFKEYDNGDHSFRIEWEYPIENEGFSEYYNNFRLVFRNENI